MNDYQCIEVEVVTGLLQGSPVLPILFSIYLSRVFRDVEKEVEEGIATSFADDNRSLVTTDLVEQLCQCLERAEIKSEKWGEETMSPLTTLRMSCWPSQDAGRQTLSED